MAIAGEVTDLSSLETRDVIFTSDGFPMEAYLARPKAPGTLSRCADPARGVWPRRA